MSNHEPWQIVDLFAGPGGLGEGFASVDDGKAFKTIVSAEVDPAARSTLRLRAFFRQLKRSNSEALEDYYRFCESSERALPWTAKSKEEWDAANIEARLIKLGSPEGNKDLDSVLDNELKHNEPWVLIGGPPCQAYSLVGRSRNRGKAEYKPEEDHRHFLYLEYLRIIQSKRPAIFVMENVKGILSSKINGELIFSKILQDLADPDSALGLPDTGKTKYKICSLVTGETYESGNDIDSVNFSNFVIKADEYGIPQGRHRVILVGVSEDFPNGLNGVCLKPSKGVGVGDLIGKLPPLRSTLTKAVDSVDAWYAEVMRHIEELYLACSLKEDKDPLLEKSLKIALSSFQGDCYGSGSNREKTSPGWNGDTGRVDLDKWFKDDKLSVWLNHQARGHMSSDLRRYVYAAIFADAHGRSPKGHAEFDLPGLAPDHKNWKTGKFCDRFKVQIKSAPSSTITSHISKDGHYFIHYDAKQCRSLTVREAARIQTFPDNYFFMGNRTQQYHQVGNAVPPLLALQIAEVIKKILMSRV
ncbi:DNA (cytosine-5)-methyltransferase 1 [Pseudomonas sp. NFACC24-1]|uniref:DNA cytosine methyltransferase n=1 Tax=Pseudomonas sp. NFACC24-1 TaxID=1566189 RepID=UPI0008EB6996|nr:DNA cytosine methyltransferase [Pseudomonas sp. NFACC24-1]SFN61946.1 DNA (cytosine-5)-methyltransferase 1 [Pseudomonas sp. NFACC24-1]